jgi:radical SAM-linked protein
MITYRIRFAKRGPLIFVSHLDFAHSFTRALKRAQIHLKYSEGFNPHPKLVFALPLSVGMIGENEYCDITITDDLTAEQVKQRLTEALTKDIEIKKVYVPEIKIGKVTSAKYELVFDNLTPEVDEIKAVLSNPPSVSKTTKSGNTKELDIKSLVYDYDVDMTEGKKTICLTLAASGENYLNPDLVLQSMRQAGLDIGEDYEITRTHILFSEK